MMTLFACFIVIAESLNLFWHVYRKNYRPVNIWQVVVILLAVALCQSLGFAFNSGATFFSLLLLYYVVGVYLEKYGNPLNFNMVSSILLGAYFMGGIVMIIINYPCHGVGYCPWHDWIFQLQGICR